MPPFVKKLSCLIILAFAAQMSWGFALLGPINEAYQVNTIGYGLGGDIGAPKNIGEEYRRNTPVIYYSFDANFLDYFGSNGVVAVESGIAVFNALTNVSKMSPALTEFPLQVTRENFVAETLFIEDMKSWTMTILCEQLGLAEPERYVWTLHDRFQLPNTTFPVGTEYLVIQRNFDPVMSPLNQFQSTPYINGTLYSYFITDNNGQGGPPTAITIPFPVDPLDFSFTTVAGVGNFSGGAASANIGGLAPGRYFMGLTRDDVGGLRYLYRTNLVNYESTGPNTLAEVTNPVPQLLFTSNLTELAQLALTNNPGTLQTLVPNLAIINSSNYFVNVLVTNVTAFFTNQPWMPVGSTVVMFQTNVVPTIQTRFIHTFANLLVLRQTPNGPTLVPVTQLPLPNGQSAVTIETDTVGTVAAPFGPVGSTTVTTNSIFNTFLTNSIVGDYVILPTNWCSVDILANQLTFITQATNFIGSATNSLTVTNSLGFTNAGTVLQISQSRIDYFTNHAFVVLPVFCVASNVALFQGIDRVRFVRRDFDSLIGRFFTPFTNFYSLNSITNNSLVPQRIQRTVNFPDILFTAQDLDSNPGSAVHPVVPVLARSINFNASLAGPGLAGPGTIESGGASNTAVIWNKSGPTFLNGTPNSFFADAAEASQAIVGVLGTFDATTNAPIVFPNGTSIVNLENQFLIGITPAHLATGQVGTAYGTGTATFNATGGLAPYSWALAPNSPSLPPGVFLATNGTLVGTPSSEGTYDFTIRLTDAAGRTVDRGYSITIFP
jgi:hypothetical protein